MKQNLLDWLEKADFTEDFNIQQICSAEFESEAYEREITMLQMVQLVKVLAYKIGVGFRRQDLIKQELIDLIAAIKPAATSDGYTDQQVLELACEFSQYKQKHQN
jgi:predicted RNase H-like nuclease